MVLPLNLSEIRGWDSVFPVSKNNRKTFYSSPMSTRVPAPLCSFTRAASQLMQSDEQYAVLAPALSTAGIRNKRMQHSEAEACSSCEVTSRPLSPRSPICWNILTSSMEGKLWINWYSPLHKLCCPFNIQLTVCHLVSHLPFLPT